MDSLLISLSRRMYLRGSHQRNRDALTQCALAFFEDGFQRPVQPAHPDEIFMREVVGALLR